MWPMKTPKNGETHFFVDEAGDPTFYNSRGRLIVGEGGCSRLLALGLIETQDPRSIRQAVLELHNEVLNDSYLQKIPSFASTSIAFHANKDCPEVRYLVYKMISKLDFKAQFIVSCKSEKVFKEIHNSDENEYYDGMVARLFQNVLHRYEANSICFSSRGSRDRRRPLELAIQRAYMTRQVRYYDFVADKVSYISELREDGTARYSRKNPFDINKAALLQLDVS
jgi:hypothetical protein